jgi:long-chain acyl-CoA synthetase
MHTEILPWLTTYQALGKEWHSLNLPVLPPNTLSDYVREHARAYGEREALVYLGAGMSYAQLDQLADRCANLLLSLGCQRGDVLACHLPNTPQYVVAMVAAARIGMVTTSISPLLTGSEIAHQANDAKVKVLLTLDALFAGPVAQLKDQVPTLEAVLVASATELLTGGKPADPDASRLGKARVLGLARALEGASSERAPDVEVPLTDVLYLMYTGGTTGLPKGAQLTSRNLFMNNLQCDVFYGYRTGREIVASAFPLFHIGGMAVLFNALRTASTFILVPDPRNIEHFCAEMKARPPTVLAAVPALFQMLVNSQAFRALDFGQLRVAISGAAPFAESELSRLEEVIGPGKVCEVYGMTETGPVQTMNPPMRFKPGFVGIPLPGTQVRIVDPQTLASLPPGQVGEIVVTGPQVMVGYLSPPGANAAALREIDGRTWMFTGDVGFMDDDGYLKICDRSKDMLNVGGYKVFSVEVENKLQSLPFVAMCAVVGAPDEQRPGHDTVQLFVQRKPGDTATETERGLEIIAFCRANMAPYKVPKEVFFVDAIPLTSVGKIDKKKLRAILAKGEIHSLMSKSAASVN